MYLLYGDNVAVTTTQITNTSWEEIYNLLVSNITDPATRGFGNEGKWIFDTMPSVRSSGDWPDYPIITIQCTLPDSMAITIGANQKRLYKVKFEIVAHSSKAEQSKILIDTIFNILDSNQSTTTTAGLHQLMSEDGGKEIYIDEERDKRVHMHKLVVRYIHYG